MSETLPSVTISTRDVQNDETRLDLHVHGEQHLVASKRISKTAIYNVIVVSNRPDFSATDGKTVHYALERSHEDLQRLHNKLSKKFPGTLIPEVPKKPISLIDNPTKAKERMKQCETFLHFCAKTPKVVKSEELLQFLAANTCESSPEDVKSTQPNQSGQREEVNKSQRTAKSALFEDAITISNEQIFSNDDDVDDELPAYARPKISQHKVDSDSNKSEPSARLYKEYSLDTRNTMTTISDSKAAIDEQVTANDESDDDDFENLIRRLEDTKLHRAKREKQLRARRYKATDWTNNDRSTSDEHAVSEVGEIGLDDISKYITENSTATANMDLDLE